MRYALIFSLLLMSACTSYDRPEWRQNIPDQQRKLSAYQHGGKIVLK